MTLTWHATEFGRRTDDERYRIVHTEHGWQLLDAEWRPLAAPTRKVDESQRMPLHLSPELLEKAFQNTVELLRREVVVDPPHALGANQT